MNIVKSPGSMSWRFLTKKTAYGRERQRKPFANHETG
jgi:hypothetical protein